MSIVVVYEQIPETMKMYFFASTELDRDFANQVIWAHNKFVNGDKLTDEETKFICDFPEMERVKRCLVYDSEVKHEHAPNRVTWHDFIRFVRFGFFL